MIYLLDVNVVIALTDPTHVYNEAALSWAAATIDEGWATCPIVQNGVLRILGRSTYPNSPGSPALVAATLARSLADPRHRFWPDDLGLLTSPIVDVARVRLSKQVTDTYLLALASSRRGALATFDRHLATDAVAGGREALHLIES